MTIEVNLVHGDDWVGMYVNGKLVEENHSFNVAWINRHMVPKKIVGFEENYAYKYIKTFCNLPDNLDEVEFD
jgi:hypothetical protein